MTNDTKSLSTEKKESQRQPIASILQPISYGIPGQVLETFILEDRENEACFQVELSTAFSFSRTKMKVLAQEIITSIKPDIVITIGKVATEEYLAAATDAEFMTPVISVAAQDTAPRFQAEHAGCPPVVSLNVEKGNVLTAARFLQEAKPHLSSILLPYSLGGKESGLNTDVDVISDFFTSAGVHVEKVPTHSMIESYREVAAQLHKHDTLFLLEGDLATERHRAFSYECSKQGITLFACTQGAGEFGAALSYAMPFASLGSICLAYARRIVFDNVKTEDLVDYTAPNERILGINKALVPLQGLNPDDVSRASQLTSVIEFQKSGLLFHRPELAQADITFPQANDDFHTPHQPR